MASCAITAQIATPAPPQEPADIIHTRRKAYYKAMHDTAKPAVDVVEVVDYANCIGAYWNDVTTTICNRIVNSVDIPQILFQCNPARHYLHIT